MTEKQKHTLRNRNNTVVGLISAISILLGGSLWIYMIVHFNSVDYVFRPLSLLSLFAVIINVSLIIFLYRRIQSSETGIWFLAFLGTIAMWSFSEFMQRTSGNLELAIDWRLLAAFSWTIMPVVYLFFALSYVDKQQHIRRLHFQTGIFLVVSAMIYGQFTTNFVLSSNYTLNAWGYDSVNGPFLSIFGIWLTSLFLFALHLFIQEYRQTTSNQKRKQIMLFIMGLSIPLAGGVTTDIILPSVGINIIPMAAFVTSLQGIIVAYGIYKHGLFSINPVSLSGEIMKTLPQPVIATNTLFEIQFMNENASTMFKIYAPFLGKSIVNLFGAENFKTINKALQEQKPANGVINIPKIPLGLEGGVVIAQAQISKIADGGGYIFAMSNITQQVLSMRIIEKEVQTRTLMYNRERARLLSSVNGLRQGFLIADSDRKISLMNTKARSMFPEIKMSDVQDGNVIDSNVSNVLESYLSGLNLDERLKTVIGSNHYIEIDGVEISSSIYDIDILPIAMSGGAIGAVVLFDDVTEKNVAERSKEEFFSIASHELRTPLTAIRGNTSMILNYYSEEIKSPDLKEMIDDIHTSSLRLIEIVNDFLDTSRLEQGKMTFDFKSISLETVIDEVIKEVSNVAKEQGNRVILDKSNGPTPLVCADKDKLKEVVYNLVGNALKFTDKGTVTLSTKVLESQVLVRVTDTGKGISQETIRLLFRKFQQASDSIITRDSTKGTGLGLYISKLLLEKMGGKIGIEGSTVGVGSTFYFTIPIAKNVQDTSNNEPDKKTINAND